MTSLFSLGFIKCVYTENIQRNVIEANHFEIKMSRGFDIFLLGNSLCLLPTSFRGFQIVFFRQELCVLSFVRKQMDCLLYFYRLKNNISYICVTTYITFIITSPNIDRYSWFGRNILDTFLYQLLINKIVKCNTNSLDKFIYYNIFGKRIHIFFQLQKLK